MIGELIALTVACSWTACALFAEDASRRLGSLVVNVLRLLQALLLLPLILWVTTGSPWPQYAPAEAWGLLLLSGLVGYVLGDFFLYGSYLLIGSRMTQLFQTLAPIFAAFSALLILGERMSLLAIGGMAVTLLGIGISVLSRRGNESGGLRLTGRGVFYAVMAALGQGVGLVISKLGMQAYDPCIPADAEMVRLMVPFSGTLMRACAGLAGFMLLLVLRGQLSHLWAARHNGRGLLSSVGVALCGPIFGVSLSLMAVRYTDAGVASTLMALTPVLILLPTRLLYGQRVSWLEFVGAVIAVCGVAMFFL